MKKVLSLALACTLAAGATAFASSPEADYLVEKGILFGTGSGLETERNATSAEALAMLYRVAGKNVANARGVGHWAEAIIEDARSNGYIEASEETVSLRGTLEVSEDTLILKTDDGISYELKDNVTIVFAGKKDGAQLSEVMAELDGKLATAVVSTVMTRSIPAQTNAYYLLVEDDGAMATYFEVGATGTEGEYITADSADGNYRIAVDPMMSVTPYFTKNIVKAQDLKKGDKVLVYSDIATMSIPALLQSEKIVLLSSAQEFAPDDEIETAAFEEMAARILPEADADKIDSELLSREDMIKFCYQIIAK